MNIYDAIKSIDMEHPYITRKSWIDGILHDHPMMFKIQPTNSPDCCIMYGVGKPGPRWNPSKEDLTADDWITVGF